MANKKFGKREVTKIARDIYNWLVDHEMWDACRIYFNGIAWCTDNVTHSVMSCEKVEDKNGGTRYVVKGIDPKDYFEYAGNILSMSFEGRFYDVMNGYYSYEFKLHDEFCELLEKHGVYCELGNAWNLTLCEI